jgi:hypothetical protein
MYQQYLILLAEILRNKNSTICFEEERFFIESPKEGTWIVTLPLMNFGAKIPTKIAECLFSCSLQSFQLQGPQLKKEGQKIVLKLAIKTPKSFTTFKQLIQTMSFHAQEWRETLRELSRQSPSKYVKQNLLFAY